MKRSLASTRTLLWIFASLSLVSANNLDHALRYRQIVPKGTGVSASPTSASSIPTSSEAPTSIISSTLASDTPESSPATSDRPSSVSTSTSPPEEEPSSTSASSDNPDTESQPASTAETQSATDIISSSQGPSTTPGPVSPASTRPVTSIVIINTVVTSVRGTPITSTFRSTNVVAVPAATSSGAPSLDGNESGSSSSGLKPSDRRVIIGTVVGIGGAILLGGIAVVLWRVWGKRRHPSDDDRDLMDSQPGSSGREKRSSVSGNDPFRSTLDQYHNPAGPVNTASNF